MAVVDFRSGGYVGAQPKASRDFHTHENGQDDWQASPNWDETRYHTDAAVLHGDHSMLGRMGRVTQYLGALVSVALILMLAIWGYKLVVRDVSGVPVIRALQGDGRVAPAEPGGELTSYTGLAVNTVASGREAKPANQVAIAPESTGLGTEDVPMGQLGAAARTPSSATELPVTAPVARVVPLPDGQAAPVVEDTTEVANTANAVPATETPANEVVTDLAGEAPATEEVNPAIAEAAAEATTAPVVASWSRPAPRPRRAAAAAAAAPAAATPASTPAPAKAAARPTEAPAAAPTPKVAASAISSGAPVVQIGAFDSNALADGEWKRVSGKFGALFSGKAQVIQKAQTNGRTFWRLRAAGFESRDEARRFCAALVAEGIDCIPAVSK